MRLLLLVEYLSGPSLVDKRPDHPEAGVAGSGKLSKPVLFGKPGDSIPAGRSRIREVPRRDTESVDAQ